MKVIAYYVLSNFGGVEVAEINEDTVTWRWNFGEPEPWKTSPLHSDEWFQADTLMIPLCELCGVV